MQIDGDRHQLFQEVPQWLSVTVNFGEIRDVEIHCYFVCKDVHITSVVSEATMGSRDKKSNPRGP